jgi:tetraacyldisaccharide 4'-kinase
MLSNAFLIKGLRILLFPFAILYGGVIALRNILYNKRILKTFRFDIPIINVGNLSTGGTGKSPMVEYIITLLQPKFKTAILSRGYKRKTKGYFLANLQTTVFEIGDEPMQFHQRFPDVAVAVGEERILAVPNLLFDKPETEVIILDDAFQHRAITAGLNLLLTDYNNRYTKDFFIPSGNLRDAVSSAERAEVVIVTKCPESLSLNQSVVIKNELNLQPSQSLFFTTLKYEIPYHWNSKLSIPLTPQTKVLLVTGIANPTPLIDYIKSQSANCETICFPDHHQFTQSDINTIKNRFLKIEGSSKLILTTRKDVVRLTEFATQLEELTILVQPVGVAFLFEGKQEFKNLMINFISNFR